jgi:hypothetical protein
MLKYKFLLLVLFFIILSQEGLISQLNWGVEFKPKFGFLIGKRGEVASLPRSHTYGGELSFVIHTNSKKHWHKACNFPTVGFTLFGASVGNKEILGDFFGSYSFIDFPFINSNRYQISGKLGAGVAFTSKVYDPILNPKNSVVSSYLNALVCFGVMNKFIFNRHSVVLGIDLTHCSNGAYKVTNIGINIPFVSIGYGYKFNVTEKDSLRKAELPFRKLLVGMTIIYSNKEIFPTGLGKAPVYGLSLFSRYFFKPKVGCEISLDVVSKQIIMRYKPEIEKSQTDLVQVGLYAGYLLPLDKFHLVIGMGVNVRDKYQPEGLFYHRIGMRYYLNNGVNLNLVLRSNWAKADFVEWGLGYTLNYKK